MSDWGFISALVGIQLTFVALDLQFRWRTRGTRYEGDLARTSTVLFLVFVVGVYLAIQFGGMALVPSATVLLEEVRAWLASALDLPLAGEEIRGPMLVAVVAVGFYLGGLVDYLVRCDNLTHDRRTQSRESFVRVGRFLLV